MSKKNVMITLDQKTVDSAKACKINISGICQESLDRAIEIRLEYLKDNKISMEEIIKSDIERKRKIGVAHSLLMLQERQLIDDMRCHALAAKAAGISRGEAETDFGKVFPDRVWNGE